MKRSLYYSLIIILFISVSLNLKADDHWEKVADIPNDNMVMDIVRTPDGTLYVGSIGIFKSTDDGVSWESIGYLMYEGKKYEFDKVPVPFSRIDFIGDTLFAVIGETLVKSVDGGNEWNIIESARDFTIHNKKIYLERSGNIRWSEDYGDTWNEFHYFEDNDIYVECYGINDDGDMYAGTYDELYILESGSEDWQKIEHNLLNSIGKYGISFFADMVFIKASNALLISSDRGQNWTVKSISLLGSRSGYLTIDQYGRLYSNSYDGLIYSDDFGTSWENLPVFFADMYNSDAKIRIINGTIYACTYGLYRTDEINGDWEKLNDNLGEGWVRDYFVDKDNNQYCYTPGFLRCRKPGGEWQIMVKNASDIMDFLMDHAGNIYYTESYYDESLEDIFFNAYRSADRGETFESIHDEELYDGSLHLEKDGDLYLSYTLNKTIDTEIKKSTDNGESWNFISEGRLSDFYLGYNGELFYDDYDKYYMSKDDGETWIEIVNEFIKEKDWLLDQLVISGDTLMMTFYEADSIYVSYDTGETISSVANGIDYSILIGAEENMDVNEFLKLNDRIYAVTSKGLYYTNNWGEMWHLVTIDDEPFFTFGIDHNPDNHLYLNTIKGVYRSKEQILSVDYQKSISESNLSIFPNPAETIAKLIYTPAVAAYAEIDIIDLSGRSVADVFSGHLAGTRIFEFDVSGFPPGAYFLRIKSGGEALTKKFVVK